MTARDRIGETIFTTPSDREIVMTRVIDAPREAVFDAWTNCEHLPHWMGPAIMEMIACQIDLRVGGSWRFVWRGPDGFEFGMSGVYLEIDAPERLVSTESMDGFPGETQSVLVLTEQDGKTTITNTVVYPSKEVRDTLLESGMKDGVAEGYDRLEARLGQLRDS